MLRRDDIDYQALGEVYPRRVFRYKMEPGDAGIRDTLTILAHLIEEDRGNPIIHKVAWKLTYPFRPEQHRERVNAIFEFMQRFTRDPKRGRFPGIDSGLVWRPDPDGVELIYDAPMVLHNGGGDCEELVMTLALLLTVVGYRTEFVVISRLLDKEFHHLLLRIPVGHRALYLDPSIKEPMGTVPADLTRVWLASTTLNPNGVVDIEKVSPETIVGERTVGPSATFGEQTTMSGICANCMSPSVLGSLGVLGYDSYAAVLTPGSGVRRLDDTITKIQSRTRSFIERNKSQIPSAAKLLSRLGNLEDQRRNIYKNWKKDKSYPDSDAKRDLTTQTRVPTMEIVGQAVKESGVQITLPKPGGSLKLPGAGDLPDISAADIKAIAEKSGSPAVQQVADTVSSVTTEEKKGMSGMTIALIGGAAALVVGGIAVAALSGGGGES